jgi:hypothetical protein
LADSEVTSCVPEAEVVTLHDVALAACTRHLAAVRSLAAVTAVVTTITMTKMKGRAVE